MSEPTDIMDDLQSLLIRQQELRGELKDLLSIKEWALDQLPFRAGDAVVIKKNFRPIPSASGWYHHRGHLIPGATGVVTKLYYSDLSKDWTAWYRPDIEWSISEYTKSVTIRKPDDRHVFMMGISALRKRRESDTELIPPEEYKGIHG